MKRCLVRIVATLLVPMLVQSPGQASVLGILLSSPVASLTNATPTNLFINQAMSLVAEEYLQPLLRLKSTFRVRTIPVHPRNRVQPAELDPQKLMKSGWAYE